MRFFFFLLAPYLTTPITVLAQPTYEMSRRATERLIQRIRNQLTDVPPTLEYYPPTLIVRRSCGESGE